MMEMWLSYAPGDFLMFGPEVYWRLFELQNRAFWPLPPLVMACGIAVLGGLATRRAGAVRAGLLVLALACLGAAQFLAARYAQINLPAAHAAWGFGLEAAVLASLAAFGGGAWSAGSVRRGAFTGWGLLAYALLLHPLAGLAFGRPLIQAEIAGLAPDPTAIACLGVLNVLFPGALGLVCSAIPLLWVSFSAATLLTLGEGQGLILVAVLLLWLVGRSGAMLTSR